MIVGGKDDHCSLENANRIKEEIGDSVVNLNVIEGASHHFFEIATDKNYVDLVDAQLEMHELDTGFL